MRRYKRFAAFTMASVLSMSAIPMCTDVVRAGETAEETVQEQEYVVLAKNDKGMEKIADTYGDEIVEEGAELENNHIAIVELTEAEADKP